MTANNPRQPAACSRREFLASLSAALAAGTCAMPALGKPASRIRNAIVLGVDGMDPAILNRLIAEGRMPNCQKLIARGGYRPLRTSMPPQSPVAWSNFISGTNPGGHGIFDFMARDPCGDFMPIPYLSTSKTQASGRVLKLGKWSIPLEPSDVINLRKGPTLWDNLQDGGVPCTVFRVPANFPPTASEARTLSGMGTPDIHGSYGIFTFFTDDLDTAPGDVSGGQIVRVAAANHRVHCRIPGPANAFRQDGKHSDVDLEARIDPERPLAKISIQDTQLILKEGEWSDWVVVTFTMLPHLVDVSGICRLYLKSAREPFALYMSPVNINPADPSMPLSTPPDYARQLVDEVGYFYTQGMAEDTAALRAGVLDDDEFRQQSNFVVNERLRFYEHELNRFDEGFLFFYFSSLDQVSHVFWRTMDPKHPQYDPAVAKKHADFVPGLYERMDAVVGAAMDRIGDDGLLLVMSDHGFTSFRRQFNLNSWLMDNGYVRARSRAARGAANFFGNVDWSQTRAYGLGINSLYLNLKDREGTGTVPPGNRESLRKELIARLTAVRDPDTGDKVITAVYRPEDIYSGPFVGEAPDLLIGYNNMYRASWDTILGKFPREHLADNMDAWSGDHCIAPEFVPGVLLSNRPIAAPAAALEDLAPTVLHCLGAPTPGEMTGSVILS